MSYAADGGTGRDETILTVPLTRGSIRKLRRDIWPMAFATASMSALTKLSMTGSSAARTPKAASARTMRTTRLPAGIAPCAGRRVERYAAPLEREALQRAAAAHHHVVGIHLAHHQLADRFSDSGRARPAVLGEDRAPGGEHADEAHRRARRRLRRLRGEQAPRGGRGGFLRAALGTERGRGLRARREQHPGAVSCCDGERRDQREIERQSDQTCAQRQLEDVLEAASHLQGIVSRSPFHYNRLYQGGAASGGP